jgi:hypothetical protein
MEELYCTYCGMAQGDRIQCCSENHWMTNEEYREYHGYAPDDGSDGDDQPRYTSQFYAWLAKQTPGEAP